MGGMGEDYSVHIAVHSENVAVESDGRVHVAYVQTCLENMRYCRRSMSGAFAILRYIYGLSLFLSY
jgi:hypothetical protein